MFDNQRFFFSEMGFCCFLKLAKDWAKGVDHVAWLFRFGLLSACERRFAG